MKRLIFPVLVALLGMSSCSVFTPKKDAELSKAINSVSSETRKDASEAATAVETVKDTVEKDAKEAVEAAVKEAETPKATETVTPEATEPEAPKTEVSKTEVPKTETPKAAEPETPAGASVGDQSLTVPGGSAAGSQKPATNVRHRSKLYGVIGGRWTIVSVGRDAIPFEEEMPYVYFDQKKWAFYGSDGCNVINGTFNLQGERNITFSNVLATQALCPDVPFQTAIRAVLADGMEVVGHIENTDLESYLTLTTKSGAQLMKLRRENLAFLNGEWTVREIGKKKVEIDGVNIFFDMDEMKVHGNTGCNYFNGSIEIDPTLESSIAFRGMAVTMRACPNTELETAFLVALEQTVAIKAEHHGRVVLLDASGARLIDLERDRQE